MLVPIYTINGSIYISRILNRVFLAINLEKVLGIDQPVFL